VYPKKWGLGLAVIATASLLPWMVQPVRADETEREKWRLHLELMVTNVRGADQQVGSTVMRDESGPIPLETSSVIQSELDTDFSARLTWEWTPGRWGLSVTGWVYDGADGDDRRNVSSDSANGIETLLRTEALLPEFVVSDTGVDLLATNHFELASVEISGSRDLAVGERSRFFATAGLRLAYLKDNRVDVLTGPTTALHRGTSEADILAGPIIGFHGRAQWRKHRVEGYLTQSVVFGNVNEDAEYNLGGASPVRSLWSDSREIALPITDIDIRWSYDLWRRVSLGVGYFASIWWDAPLAPIGNTAVGPARTNESTFVVSGPTFSVFWRSAPR
jgi:hypothetical protein